MPALLKRTWAGRLAWLGHWLYEPNKDRDFNSYLESKYSKSFTPIIKSYLSRYGYLLNSNSNLAELDSIKESIRNNLIKSLIIYSKFKGFYEEFSKRLKDYGIKLNGVSSYNAFIRIYNNTNNTSHNVLEWINQIKPYLRDNENLFIQFLKATGIRKNEGIESFNLIIQLAKLNRLSEYYGLELNCLQHFKYPKLFIRKTKNLYISFIPESLVNAIANSETVSYSAIRKRLERKGILLRINELRDYHATLLINNGFNELEVNLLQGRISGILFKHYWSPRLSELRDRIFKVLDSI
jgi:hypothetical protein